MLLTLLIYIPIKILLTSGDNFTKSLQLLQIKEEIAQPPALESSISSLKVLCIMYMKVFFS